ncbi:hypothetical protein [Arsenicicoccus dermatophilus]|uniref:hypothetical protein n=1 Tax=Arsenicicoccus dermatophilus TaxID=1076331 RepID=UPI001F4D27F0|nr:hypothetical protein [Arsenicicoccus dermatophilus]MCH8612077.1 hypothetical protein [Arsenicicoccus dermatophilus]
MTGSQEAEGISWRLVAAHAAWIRVVWGLVWLVTGLWLDPQRRWTDALHCGLVVAAVQVVWDVAAARRRRP